MKTLMAIVAALLASHAVAQVTGSLTYQGRLSVAGSPANGTHDLRFRLYDLASGGAQVGPTLCADNVAVADGLFRVTLDFGAQFNGQSRFLEIEDRPDSGLNCSNSAGFTILSPRQELTATPHAAYALSAADTTRLGGQTAAFYSNAANLTGTLADARLSTNVPRLNQANAFTGAVTATSFSGSGAGLTALSASNISGGTLADGRLSTNVALLAASQTFGGANTFSNASNAFTGSGAGLTALNAANITAGTLADTRLSTNVALLGSPQTFTALKTFSTAPAFTASGAPFTVSNSGVVTNLNADLLDGLSSSAFALTSHTHDASAITTGLLADARLSTNIPRLNGANAFSGATSFTTAPNFAVGPGFIPFTVQSQVRVDNLNAHFLNGMQSSAFAAANHTHDASAITAGTLADARLSSNIPRLNQANVFTGAVTANSFTGTGANLTGLSAGNLGSGTLSDARLSSNVALLSGSQTYTGARTFSAATTFNNDLNITLGGRTLQFRDDSGLGPGINLSGGGYLRIRNALEIWPNDAATSPGRLDVRNTSGGPTFIVDGASGNTSAAGVLQVDAADANDGTFTNGMIRLGGGSSGEGIASNRTSDANGNRYGIDFYTGGAQQKRMSITNGGTVGVGTAAPGMSLEVRGPGTYYGKPTLGVSDASHWLYMLADGGTDPAIIWNSGRGLRFGSEPSPGGGFQETLRITSGGSLGIGTGAPTGRFEVRDLNLGPDVSIVDDGMPSHHTLFPLSSSWPEIGQTWTPGIAGVLTRIDVQISNGNGTAQAVLMRISGPGLPGGGTSPVQVNVSPTGGLGHVVTVTFPLSSLGITLQAGQVYTFALTRPTYDNLVGVLTRSDNPYPGGSSTVCPICDVTFTSYMSTGLGGAALVVTDGGSVGMGTISPGANKLRVEGNVSATSIDAALKSFKIDHPLDPANKYLLHSCVESPDMMNIYNGNVVTDADGYATIALPDWFEALNRDFRYQLTVIDEADDMDVFLWAKVVREVADNRFMLRSSRGGLKVSWQVTGIRKDAVANARRIPLEVDKEPANKGRYLHPEAFGLPPSKGIFTAPAAPSPPITAAAGQ